MPECVTAVLHNPWTECKTVALVRLSAKPNRPSRGFAKFCGFAPYDVTMFRRGFGPTGVAGGMRGFGVGKTLFFRWLRDMKERGYQHSEVGRVGPIPFYAHIADATFIQGRKDL